MNLSLYQLYTIREMMEEQNLINDEKYKSLCEKITKVESLLEDGGGTSATGGPSVGGMGAVVSAQPSGLAGATIGTSWASHGGTTGSGDVSVPYNPSGANRVFQKVPAPGFEMGKEHGPRTGKKSRTKKLDMKTLKNIFAKRQDFTSGEGEVKKASKVMNFNNFLKNDFTTIKK
jgi:hypothetical protein